ARGVAGRAAGRGRARDPPARRAVRRDRRVVLRAEGAAPAARVARIPAADRAPAPRDAGRRADRRRRRPPFAGGGGARGCPDHALPRVFAAVPARARAPDPPGTAGLAPRRARSDARPPPPGRFLLGRLL